jgi:hypothetical protein
MNKTETVKSKIFWVALTIVITLGLIWLNTYRRSSEYYKQGEALLAQGKVLEAITSYEISAHAYTPLNPHVRRSMDKLWELGQRLENEKEDPGYALIAYRSLRSSVFAIRSFYMPYKEWIPRCDERIQALVGVQKQQMEAARTAKPTPVI